MMDRKVSNRSTVPAYILFATSVVLLAAAFTFFLYSTRQTSRNAAQNPDGSPPATAYAADTNNIDPERRTPIVIAIEKTSPTVVNVNTEQVVRESTSPFGGMHDEFFNDFFKDFYDMFPQRDYKRTSLGSGVIFNDEGYILTNEHVILAASKISVALPDNREFEARLVGADPNLDLAIIKINTKAKLPAAELGDSDSLLIGEPVIAIGNPFGLEHTVTTGVVSALKRSIRISRERVYSDFIQTDASINPGNSGGPLINIKGQVIGINTAIIEQAQGIGFAIPINRVKRAMRDLLQYGEVKKAWLGIRTQELTSDLAAKFGYENRRGVLVTDVIAKGPADRAGLKTGDIVSEINGAAVSATDDFREKTNFLLVGEKTAMSVFRNGRWMKITLEASPLPLDEADEIAEWLLGLKVDDITRAAISRYNLATDSGVVITSVTRGGLAARIGLTGGDVIRQIGSMEIRNMKDFREAIVLSAERGNSLLVIQRGRYIYHTTFD